MPVDPHRPDVYVNELDDSPPAIVAAATAVTAFVGPLAGGPAGAQQLLHAADLDRVYGAAGASLTAEAVAAFFANGGREAWVVRAADAAAMTAAFAAGGPLDRIAPTVTDLVCLPDAASLPPDEATGVLAAAHAFCAERGGLLLIDPPAPGDTTKPILALAAAGYASAAAYYPWVVVAAGSVPPSGTVAGIIATADAAEGPWRPPAGLTFGLAGVTGPAGPALHDEAAGELSVAGVNPIRSFAVYGTVVWGARTCAGEHIAVRRTTDWIARSLRGGLAWTAFETDGPGLRAHVLAAVESFLVGVWKQGALGGATPADAFALTYDGDGDAIDLGVGLCLERPGEFEWLRLRLPRTR